jgi:hypothetical protein
MACLMERTQTRETSQSLPDPEVNRRRACNALWKTAGIQDFPFISASLWKKIPSILRRIEQNTAEFSSGAKSSQHALAESQGLKFKSECISVRSLLSKELERKQLIGTDSLCSCPLADQLHQKFSAKKLISSSL